MSNITIEENTSLEEITALGMPGKDLQFTREDVVSFFDHNHKVQIVFTKKDGSERTMLCTRSFDAIPKGHRPFDKTQIERPGKPAPDFLYSVFDLGCNDWRSFTIAKLLDIQPAS